MCRQAARQRRRKCVERSCSASRAANGGSPRGGHAGYENNECRLSYGSVEYSPSFAHSPPGQSAAARRMRRRQSRRRPVLPYASHQSRGAILRAGSVRFLVVGNSVLTVLVDALARRDGSRRARSWRRSSPCTRGRRPRRRVAGARVAARSALVGARDTTKPRRGRCRVRRCVPCSS